LNLPGGIVLNRAYDQLEMRKNVSAKDGIRELIIFGPGSYQLENGSSLLISEQPGISSDGVGMIQLDPTKAPFPWLVRSYQPGDRIRPVGMTGTKKVKDLFIDKKIPLDHRRQVPLVFSGDTLIWVCGVRASAEAIADKAAKKTLSARYYS
jgi:tRNA(Ile)-lysidine synthase